MNEISPSEYEVLPKAYLLGYLEARAGREVHEVESYPAIELVEPFLAGVDFALRNADALSEMDPETQAKVAYEAGAYVAVQQKVELN